MRSYLARRYDFSLRDISPNFLLLVLAFVAAGVLLYLLPGKITVLLFVAMGWVVSLCIHEFGHALAAYYGGDYEVMDKGYLTLDPLKYVHPVLSILLPIAFLLMGGIGLPGGAVYVNRYRLRSDGWRSLTSAAGPLGSLACLLLLWIPLILGMPRWFGPDEFWAAWTFLAFVEISAILLNLLPLPGIDGFGIIEPWLPPELVERVNVIRPYAFLILFALFYVPGFAGAFWDSVMRVAGLMRLDGYLISLGYSLFRLVNL